MLEEVRNAPPSSDPFEPAFDNVSPPPESSAQPPMDDDILLDQPPIDEDPLDLSPPSPPPTSNAVHSTTPRPYVEDEYEDPHTLYIEPYPAEAQAGKSLGDCQTPFERKAAEDHAKNLTPWHPFRSQEEWELASWLMKAGLSRKDTNAFLDLSATRIKVKPSFHNQRALLKKIKHLPRGPEWTYSWSTVEGDILDSNGQPLSETFEVWHRNPLDCIEELLSNPAFQGHIEFAPHRVYRTNTFEKREWSEMWTADWWWEKQGVIPKGGTVAPVILSSDKTTLTRFAGDKSAWPVYLSVGNISKELRRKPSARAMVLVGYVPVMKLECCSKDERSIQIQRLFHECMRTILKPLVEAGLNGVKMVCADGCQRMVYPILAAYIADYPEQCLVAGIRTNSCPECDVNPKHRGDHQVHSNIRDSKETLEILREVEQGAPPRLLKEKNILPLIPFWSDLPHCNIHECFTPDLLHQLHKGVFKDHVVNWATQALPGHVAEVDARFQAMTPHQDLRHFKKGISLTSQWTGREHKEMEKVFLGILAEATNPRVILAVRGALDFIYYAHFAVQTEESLQRLDNAWLVFHQNKDIFQELEIRTHFNISKIHNIRHYVDMIRTHGTTDGYNTESTERLHIDLAKVGYAASNKKEYITQMTDWLTRHEAIDRFCRYLQWVVPGYEASVSQAEDDPGQEEEDNEEEQEEEEEEAEQEEEDEEEDEEASFADTHKVVHTVAKNPAVKDMTVEDACMKYKADNLLHHLNAFLGENNSSKVASLHTPLSIYNQAALLLPGIREVSLDPVKDRIFASASKPAQITTRGLRDKAPGKFSTVLVRTRPAQAGQGPLDGISLGQVRLIFRLPDDLLPGTSTSPLLHVRWFKELRDPVPGVGMIKTSFASQNHRPRASIVRLDTVSRSCHLIPAYGRRRATSLGWTSEQVLDEALTFYLNPYLRHYDFFLLRYNFGLFLDARAARERRVEEARMAAERRRAKRKRVVIEDSD